MITAQKSRRAAFDSLLSIDRYDKFANLEVNASLERSELSGPDAALYTALVYGVCERSVTLDYIISSLSSRSLDKIDKDALCALRLGLYQLIYMDRIPPHAAVSESVELCKRSRSFVNALLREFLRRDCRFELPCEGSVCYLSVKYSAPQALCSFWLERYGYEKTERLLSATIKKPRVSVRVNTLCVTPEELISRLSANKIESCVSPLCPDMLVCDSSANLSDIISGVGFVQDVSSRLCVSSLAPQPGEVIVDTCSCPGGKAFSAAIDMKNEGRLFAFDLHENKLSLVKRGAEALGIGIITAACRDARSPDISLIGKADRVLCDVPCSGLGVIAKKPDIKYKSPDIFRALPAIQYQILIKSSEYVKAGGVLVYSTCTLNPDENERVFERFLSENSEFSPCDFDLFGGRRSSGGAATILPYEYDSDGFFIAKAVRT